MPQAKQIGRLSSVRHVEVGRKNCGDGRATGNEAGCMGDEKEAGGGGGRATTAA